MKTSKAGLARKIRKAVPVIEKLWRNVDVRSDNECWVWTGKTANFGYGIIQHRRGYALRAHRVSWIIKHGQIPPGMVICHKCDNPPCVNPSHLFLGTKQENTNDMVRKGRMKKPPVRFGEQHHRATIPNSEIERIRASNETYGSIAAKYGVSPKTIYRIKKRITRSHEDQQSRA